MARPEDEPAPKPVRWAGSSRDDLSRMLKNPLLLGPLKKVQMQGGARIPQSAFRNPQWGGGPFSAACDVLQAFQKQSKRGVATPRQDMALIAQRFLRAKEDYEQWQSELRRKRP